MRRSKKGDPADGVLDADTVARLSAAVTPASLAPEVVARMRERVLAGTRQGTEVLRATQGEWQSLLPGITVKTLHLDREQGVQTSLWRLQPGARIPPHPHSRDEECLVLEGSITHDGIEYGAGDFLYARPGVRHKDFLSPKGALLMIRGEPIPNKLLLRLAMHLPG